MPYSIRRVQEKDWLEGVTFEGETKWTKRKRKRLVFFTEKGAEKVAERIGEWGTEVVEA